MPLRSRQKPHPRYGQYRRYKDHLRQDFQYRCAYCDIHEAEWGGHRHFHVEHLRPRKSFPWLEAEYTNLLYACDICNCYKGSDWPNDNPTPETRGYLDPCQYNYDQYFAVHDDGTVEGKAEAARYMIEALHLNRRHLQHLRIRRHCEEEMHRQFMQVFDDTEARVAAIEGQSARERVLRKLMLQLIAIYRQHLGNLWDRRWKPPYEPGDI